MKTITEYLNSSKPNVSEAFKAIPTDLITKLNDLLANTYVMAQAVRAVHWNLVGSDFIENHEELGDFYDELNGQTDMLAERLRTLGQIPVSTITEMLTLSKIVEFNLGGQVDSKAGMTFVLSNASVLQDLFHDAQRLAAQVDEGTNNMLSNMIVCLEKRIWFFKSVAS